MFGHHPAWGALNFSACLLYSILTLFLLLLLRHRCCSALESKRHQGYANAQYAYYNDVQQDLSYPKYSSKNSTTRGTTESRNMFLKPMFSVFQVPHGTKWSMNHEFQIPFLSNHITVTIPVSYTYEVDKPEVDGSSSSNNADNSGSGAKRRVGLHQTAEDQWFLFSAIEDNLRRLGLDGRQCLLRAICEINLTPMRDLSLLGEILTVVLSPRKTLQEREFIMDYLRAEEVGRSSGQCWQEYYACPFSIHNFINTVHYWKRR